MNIKWDRKYKGWTWKYAMGKFFSPKETRFFSTMVLKTKQNKSYDEHRK